MEPLNIPPKMETKLGSSKILTIKPKGFKLIKNLAKFSCYCTRTFN
jgi:hypothetical protein